MSEFTIKKHIINNSENCMEYQYEISNDTDKDLWISEIVMYEVDSLEKMGIQDKHCKFFRSGRHKNDMPSVFSFGKIDESMMDAIGAMTEDGERSELHGRKIVSDHLSIIGSNDNYVMISYITGRNQLVRTEVVVDDNGEFLGLKSVVEFGIRLEAGKSIESEIIRIEHTDNPIDAIEKFADDKADLYGSRNNETMSVFCTWYYYGLTVSYEDVKTNLKKMQELKLPFKVFQIDEGWEITLGEWSPNEKFPIDMKSVAKEIKEAGYRPGIWISPFIAHETASVWKEHPEWKLRDKDGKPCLFPMNDTVYEIFDITIPETWNYFEELYRKLTYEWGYTYHKLDFTRAAVTANDAVYYDDTITAAKAYYKAVSAIRRGMGEESYFLMCGGLYDPVIGIVDAQRTGSDVLSMWSSNINKDGKTAPYTIKQSILRYYMNRWWNNDPDALMVRKNENMERNLRLTYGLLNDEEVKTVVLNQLIGGGIVCSTEPLDKITPDRLYQLRHILPVRKVKAYPKDVMSDERFPENIILKDVNDRDSIYVVRINWDDNEDMDIEFTLNEYVSDDTKYVVSDYYSGEYYINVLKDNKVKFQSIKPHGSTIIKVTKIAEKPIVIASDGHFLMGTELGEELFGKKVNYKIMYPNEGCVIKNVCLQGEGLPRIS